MKTFENNKIFINSNEYIYRVEHLTLEGSCSLDHGPRNVKIKKLYADKYPVTNKQYISFVKKTGYKPQDSQRFLAHKPQKNKSNHPVVCVSQNDAMEYAKWVGGRLPTDEEWQYIAAGPDYLEWPWGAEFDPSLCNHNKNSLTAVNSYKKGASWIGCEDLSGNAWEWTAGVYDDGEHQFALLRGGSFYYAHDHWHVGGGARKTNFHWKLHLLNEGMNRASTLGFRCVYDA